MGYASRTILLLKLNREREFGQDYWLVVILQFKPFVRKDAFIYAPSEDDYDNAYANSDEENSYVTTNKTD